MEEEIFEFTPNEYAHISEMLKLIYAILDQEDETLSDFIEALDTGGTIVIDDSEDETDQTIDYFESLRMQ